MASSSFFPLPGDRTPLAFVLSDFPFPIAVTYARFHDELARQEPVPATWQLLDAFQSLLKFTACVAVADCLQAKPEGALVEQIAGMLFKPLSLGDWQDLLETPLRSLTPLARAGRLDDSGWRLPNLYAVFFDPRSGKRSSLADRLFNRMNIVRWRNQVFGHGVFKQNRQAYADEVNRWRPLLNEVCEALRPALAGWSLVSQVPNGEQVIWQGTLNLPPTPPHAHQPGSEPLPMRLARLGKPEAPPLLLGPLLTVQKCSVCSQPAAFFLEGNEFDRKKDRHRSFFQEYFAGHANRRDDWDEAKRLAARLPAQFDWERSAYNWRQAAEDGRCPVPRVRAGISPARLSPCRLLARRRGAASRLLPSSGAGRLWQDFPGARLGAGRA